MNFDENQLTSDNILGKGTYGSVYKYIVIDEDGDDIAIAIKVPNEQDVEYINCEKQIYLHLNKFIQHANILTIYHDIFVEYPFLVMEYADCNLREIIYNKNIEILPIKKWISSIVKVMTFLHLNGVVHRDLCCNNFLVFYDTLDIKISDFGSSSIDKQRECDIYEYTSEYYNFEWYPIPYRAPELAQELVFFPAYSDIWAIGCIFWEIIYRKRLFKTFENKNNIDLLIEIKNFFIDTNILNNVENLEYKKILESCLNINIYKREKITTIFKILKSFNWEF